MAFGDIQKISYPFGKNLTLTYDVIEAGDYSSYKEFKDTVKSLFMNPDNFYRRGNQRKYGYTPLERIESFNHLLELEQEADDSIEEIVQNFLEFRIKNQATIPGTPSFQFDVQGQTVDFGRLLAGEPECMIDFFGAAEAEFRQLDITIGISSPKFLNSKKMPASERLIVLFIHFLPILELIDEWETKGIRCRIKAILRNGPNIVGRGIKVDQFVGSVMLKDYSDILDIELFCRVFMTSEMQNLSYLINIMLTNPKHGEGSHFANLDYVNLEECCFYDPTKPMEVNFPSIWFAERIGFKRITGRNLLELLQYPII